MNYYIVSEVVEHCEDDAVNLCIQFFFPNEDVIQRKETDFELWDFLTGNYLINLDIDKTLGYDCLKYYSDYLGDIAQDLMTCVKPEITIFFLTYINEYYKYQVDGDREEYKEWCRFKDLTDYCREIQAFEVKNQKMTEFLVYKLGVYIPEKCIDSETQEFDFDHLAWCLGHGRCDSCYLPKMKCNVCRDKFYAKKTFC